MYCVHTGKRGGVIKRRGGYDTTELAEGEEITKRLGVCCYKCMETAKQLTCFSSSVLLFHASIFPQQKCTSPKVRERLGKEEGLGFV